MDYEYEYEDEAPQGRVLWGRIGLLALALLLVFLAGRCTAGDGASEEEVQALSQEVEDLREQRDALQAELDAFEAGGVDDQQDTATEQDEGGDGEDGGQNEEDADAQGDSDTAEEDTEENAETSEADGGESTRTHEVEANDTLYTIAEEYYGDGSHFTLITEANNLSRDDPLRVGQVLDIPPME